MEAFISSKCGSLATLANAPPQSFLTGGGVVDMPAAAPREAHTRRPSCAHKPRPGSMPKAGRGRGERKVDACPDREGGTSPCRQNVAKHDFVRAIFDWLSSVRRASLSARGVGVAVQEAAWSRRDVTLGSAY
jgi:hypothetical protein